MNARLDLDAIAPGLDALMGRRPSAERLTLRATVLEVVAEVRRLRAELAQAEQTVQGARNALAHEAADLRARLADAVADGLAVRQDHVDAVKKWQVAEAECRRLREENTPLWAVAEAALARDRDPKDPRPWGQLRDALAALGTRAEEAHVSDHP